MRWKRQNSEARLKRTLSFASSSGSTATIRTRAGDRVSVTFVTQLFYPTLVALDVLLVLRKQTFV